FLHGMPYRIAPEAQKHVPMVAWLGTDLLRRSQLSGECLRAGADTPLAHDVLYHSVLGLLDVQSPSYRRSLDAFATCKGRA
ncbi:MAG: phosphoethanolamine transferase, partial [Giesbergeria sp.]|nr:phosphoethanolamine transferase [Giesbergeria sp.]